MLVIERGDSVHLLTGDADRFARRRDDAYLGTLGDERGDDAGHFVDEVLAVVDDQPQRSPSQPIDHRLVGGQLRLWRNREGVADDGDHRLWFGELTELDQPGTVVVLVDEPACQLHGQPCLADAAGAGEREQRRGAGCVEQRAERLGRADERADEPRQVRSARRHRPERRELRSERRVQHLEQRDDAEVAQPMLSEAAQRHFRRQGGGESAHVVGEDQLTSVRSRRHASRGARPGRSTRHPAR